MLASPRLVSEPCEVCPLSVYSITDPSGLFDVVYSPPTRVKLVPAGGATYAMARGAGMELYDLKDMVSIFEMFDDDGDGGLDIVHRAEPVTLGRGAGYACISKCLRGRSRFYQPRFLATKHLCVAFFRDQQDLHTFEALLAQ